MGEEEEGKKKKPPEKRKSEDPISTQEKHTTKKKKKEESTPTPPKTTTAKPTDIQQKTGLKGGKSPPIKFNFSNQKEIIRLLTELFRCKDFHITKVNKNTSSLQINNLEVYKKTVDLLKERSYQFHTYTPKNEKPTPIY